MNSAPARPTNGVTTAERGRRHANRSKGAAGEPQPARERRCGIYTRVSTDEQAAIEYNSLQAQEEICKSYIAIRGADPALERKWVHAETYSDAGFSGGTLERPAMQRLLADIETGKVDVIVAYKIDRISRSISQFYEIWNLLERCKVDFASATQEFNTATSQGKLMLNLLLSFAQYERELIGERTRDKIAAAKKRGRWCGGPAILGYDLDRNQKRLVVNEAEARVVRDIFAIYLQRASMLRAIQAFKEKGYRTKESTSANGRRRGGHSFDKNMLSNLLRNPVYVGKIRHHDKVYDGQHDPIVDLATFERVQKLLADHWNRPRPTTRHASAFLLRGLVRCAVCDRAMSPNFAYSKGRKYLYYTCTRVMKEGADACVIRSVSAPALEDLLLERLGQLVDNEALVAKMVSQAGVDAGRRLPELQQEKDRIEAELRRRREEAARLVDAIASGATAARSVHDRLREVEAAIETSERRLKDLTEEAARFESALVTPGQVCAALRSFTELWKHLEQTEKVSLVRLVVREVVYDGRDTGDGRCGKISWRLQPLTVGAATDSATLGFEHGEKELRKNSSWRTAPPLRLEN